MSRVSAILCSFFLAGCGAEPGAAETPPAGAARTVEAAAGTAPQDAARADLFEQSLGGETVPVLLAGVRTAEPGTPEAAEAIRRRDAFLDAAGEALLLDDVIEGRDRYGRRIAHLRTPEGAWLQADLVEAGLAVVSSLADADTLAALAPLEAGAREASRGGWGSGIFVAAPPDADLLSQRLFSEQLVEGVVLAAAEGRDGRVYLNFGADWRTDFTVTVPADLRADFERSHGDALALEGARVRVRGWVRAENGPMIRLASPPMLEVLDGYANPLNSPE